MVDLVTSPRELTAEWLTDALREAGELTEGRVCSVDHSLIGTGKMGDNVRLQLNYEGAQGAPKTLVAKLPAGDETARSMAGALGAYYNESMFYRHLASGERIEITHGTKYVLSEFNRKVDVKTVIEDDAGVYECVATWQPPNSGDPIVVREQASLIVQSK